MKPKLKFTRQILVFVYIPMLIQVALIVLLLFNTKQLEHYYNQEEKAADFLSENVRFLAQMMSCAGTQAMYQATKDPKYERDFQTGIKAITAQSVILKERSRAVLGDRKEAADLERMFATLQKLSEKGQQAAATQDQIDQAIAYFQLRRVINQVNKLSYRIIDQLNTDRRLNKQQSREARTQIYVVIIPVAIAINVFVLILFIFYFDRIHSKRFEKLSENVVALGANQPLPNALSGSDDISELDSIMHKVANELADARRKEMEIERLRRDLVAMVSHDLRSPMTSLQVTLNILSSGALGDLPDSARKRVDRAETSLFQLVEMLDDFLEFEKLDSAVYEMSNDEIDGKEVVSRAVVLLTDLANKKGVEIEFDAPSVSMRGDAAKLVRVLTNLISNAIKFSPDGSKIEVTLEQSGSDAVFRVKDQGPGIPKEQIPLMFERFKQLDDAHKDERGGIGLGLAVCKAIVDGHKGEISVESEVGKGTTFTVRVPTNK